MVGRWTVGPSQTWQTANAPDQTGLFTIDLLAQLDVVVDVSALDGLAHDRGLANPRLQLPLRREVDDH